MTEVVPFALKDAPALIERAWPTSKISEEVQKERKAGSGQTLTRLGSYWKGRKPLILTRACLLASLMPASDDAEGLRRDIEIFERVMAFDLKAMTRRLPTKKRDLLTGAYRDQVLAAMRPEEISESKLLSDIWNDVNAHLGTDASSVVELVEQLGVMRFGRRPKVADTFSGSGSIPFEAARIGCDVYASDLNPIACMLTWGSFNVVGASDAENKRMAAVQDRVLQDIEDQIASLSIEHDDNGNRAKVFLYCLETRCPRTGYMVPMAPSWVVSKGRNVIARLVPDHIGKRYDIEILSGVTDAEVAEATHGTVRSGRLYHTVLDDDLGIPIKEIRGDHKGADGKIRNYLRQWDKSDFMPSPDDIWQERLYCIQWIDGGDIASGKGNPHTWFAAPTSDDYWREDEVKRIVRDNLEEWQEAGFIPDMRIEPGNKTDEPIRTRGWTHWHHLFGPRHLLVNAIATKHAKKHAFMCLGLAALYDRSAKTTRWHSGRDGAEQTFDNQAINTMLNYPARSWRYSAPLLRSTSIRSEAVGTVVNQPSSCIDNTQDIILTDPPYADAVQYDEITEFFIAWLRKSPPAPFDQWIWDSRRAVAIKGSNHAFKLGMIEAYKAMTDNLSDNGLQIVQFTHQDNGVWADMAQIFWGAGLQVVQDWVVSTETTSELKRGGYVQGTHNIVCRKRKGRRSGYSNELFGEIDDEVQRQIADMTGINQSLSAHDSPNIFSDDDLHTAGYAAALRVLTSYTHIDGEDMAAEAMRPRREKGKGIVDKLVQHAAKAAAQALVPVGLDQRHWRTFTNPERFYLKMVDIETEGAVRLELFQRYSKAYHIEDQKFFMASNKANDASMKTAMQFGRRIGDLDGFGAESLVRLVLRAICRVHDGDDTNDVLSDLRDLVPDYYRRHDVLIAIADFVAGKRRDNQPLEASAARILRSSLQNEKI